MTAGNNLFQIPDALALTGLRFRHVAGEEDAAALCAVRQGCAAHDAVDPLSTVESIPGLDGVRSMLAEAVVHGEQDRWLVTQVGEQVAGYGRFVSWLERDGIWVYLTLGWVLPAWRGRGIGTALLRWTEERIRRLAAAEHPGEKIEFAANASTTEREATALLLHEGYHAAYTVLEMGLDAATPLPAAPLPAGVAVLPATPDHFPLIAASVGEAYEHEYEGGRFDEGFDPAAWAAELGEPKHDPSLWQIAWDGDRVVGQVMAAVERSRGELFEVSVRPAWRRRGLARALLVAAAQGLRARGVDVIRLHTNADFRTRARDLYESVGFRVLKEFPRYRKPLEAG